MTTKKGRSLPSLTDQAPAWSARHAFESGHHREVVERVRFPGCSPEEAMALIGSMSFLGRLEEAKEIWAIAHGTLSPQERARARFAMAIANTRISRFKSAKRWLKENLVDLPCKELPDTFQGLAIYHYYLGRFDKAAACGRQAMRRSMELGDSYIRIFATDLYGHALVQTGRRSAGLRLLGEARELSGGTNKSDPYKPAQLVYEAEAGLKPEKIVEELQALLASVLPEDTYTRANLTLELARQLTLRGKWKQARDLLDQESQAIYAYENRRHEATLQLRLAEIAYRQGDAAGATHFLQAARRCLNKIADSVFEIRIIGLEHKIERRLLGRTPSSESLARLEQLSASHSSPMNTRIRARAADSVSTTDEHRSEDPLGELLDLVATQKQNAEEEVLRRGYLGLWPEIYGLKPGHEHLIVRESGDWFAISRDGVERSKAPLSTLSRRLLNRLALGPANKEQLVKDVWGYEYDPIRQDAMIYAALSALRKSLGDAARWIQSHDEGWSLGESGFGSSHKQFLFLDEGTLQKQLERSSKVRVETPPNLDEAQNAPPSELNWRQLKALRESRDREKWTVPDYKNVFQVSTMTAWRDLDGLMKTGYLRRIGRGRSTVYLSAQLSAHLAKEIES